jgi:hypothetical protein
MYRHKWCNWHPWIDLKAKEMFCSNCRSIRHENFKAMDCPGKYVFADGKATYLKPDDVTEWVIEDEEDGEE